MNYRNLGTGLKVPTLCLGAMNFGGTGMDERTCHSLLNRALDFEINFVDTADAYGRNGLSEQIIGNWFKQSGRRNSVVLATKFRFGGTDGRRAVAASRSHIMQACEASLKRLKTDYIDLYQIHMQDMDTPEEETLKALDDLVRQGKTRHIGCCNYAAYRIVESLWLGATKGLAGWASLQAQYSLLERSIEREHVPACVRHGVGIIAWSPLAGGFLTGKYEKGEKPPSESRFKEDSDAYGRLGKERNWTILRAVDKVAKEVGASALQVSLAWLLCKPGVSSIAIGPRTVEQLEDNLSGTMISLSGSQVKHLDEVSAPDLGYPYLMIERVHGRW